MAETDNFGSWVRHHRRELDLTQEELARRVGCARITVRKIEAEQLRPSRQMARLLGEQLGVPPGQLDAFQRFARGAGAFGPSAPGSPPHNLPLQLTSLIGRETDVLEVRRLLRKSRLVTLTGSGGTGKTRLSLQVAAEALDAFKDGAWLIELAPLSDPSLLPNTVASVLGVREEPGRPLLSTLMDWLRSRQVLIVLDNCEHLIGACAVFAESILRSTAATQVLATSREALGISAETSYRVPSLASPDAAQAAQLPIARLQDFPALRLFVERAGQAGAAYSVTEANKASIVQICRRLDGIPLAIELAAARVRLMRVEQIAERLDDRFRLLTNGSQTALARHQTLRSLIDWSHNLLTEPERSLLRRLSVFAGGWTLEAAEGVCAGDGLEPGDILDLLTHLVDKSLIALDESAPEPRFGMLETIREYARQRLVEAGEQTVLRDHHLRYFSQLAERTQSLLNSSQRVTWLPRMQADHDNLRAALDWACSRDVEMARLLAGLLERFWFFGDHLGEARAWYSRVLQGADEAAVSTGLAYAHLGSGCVAFNQERMDDAQASLEKSVALWQQLGNPERTAWAQEWLAYLHVQRGDAARAQAMYAEYESQFRAASDGLSLVWVLSSWASARALIQRHDPTSKALLDEALSSASPLEDPFAFMMCYSCLGDWAMLQGDLATATGYFQEALKWRRQLGTRWIITAGLWQVASILRLRGEYSQAEPLYAEALALAHAAGDQHTEAHIAQELGTVAVHLGDTERARSLLEESLASFRSWEDPLGIARALLAFADLRLMQAQAETAARLLGFLEFWLESNRIQLLHFDRANYDRSILEISTRLGEQRWTSLRVAGREMSFEQAVAHALQAQRPQAPVARLRSSAVR